MKKAVMYGAGNIGRGFIGKVFSDSGYEVVFLDIMQDVIDEMNRRGEYTVRIVSNEGEHGHARQHPFARSIPRPIRQSHEIADLRYHGHRRGREHSAARRSGDCKGHCRAHGAVSGKPLNIILCENQLEVDKLMREWLYACFTDEQKTLGGRESRPGRAVDRAHGAAAHAGNARQGPAADLRGAVLRAAGGQGRIQGRNPAACRV